MKKIFLLALIIRLICLYLFRNVTNYDLQSYLLVGELTLKGINIYPKVASLHHPYQPFFLYFELAAVWLGGSKIMALAIIKVINILFDIGILYMVYLLSKKNLKTIFYYAINPVTILITTLHGQFDVIPTFFILLTIYLLHKKHELRGILSFSLAVLTKTWPILFFIPIARKFKNKKLLILIFLFPILFTVIYVWLFNSSFTEIGKTIVNYHGIWGIWGISSLFGKWRLRWRLLFTALFLISFLIFSKLIKEKKLINSIFKLLIFFYIFTTSFSIQYLVWFIPFLFLIKPKKYVKLIFLITIYLISFYYFWLFCQDCKTTPNWLILFQTISGLVLWIKFIKMFFPEKNTT